MAFELVRTFFSQGSPLRSWTPEPTMGNGASMDQGGHTTHSTRDVSEGVELERYDWSELARAPITKQPNSLSSTDRNLYIGASNVGPKSSTLLLPTNGHSNSPTPPKSATPVPHTDASVCSTSARIAAQYAEERTSHPRRQKNGAAMQVESTDVPIQKTESMPSSSIQTAYTPSPWPPSVQKTGLPTLVAEANLHAC